MTRVLMMTAAVFVLAGCEQSINAGNHCGPSTCDGCCQGDRCEPGTSASACGLKGLACDVCVSPQVCSSAARCGSTGGGGGAGGGAGGGTGGGAGGGTGGGAGGGTAGGAGGGITSGAPTFVAAGPAALLTAAASLTLSSPNGLSQDDLVLALVDAEEESGPRTLTAPTGWTLVGGFPIHNLANAHAPYVIPAIENHGTWLYYRFSASNEPATHSFVFASNTTARGVIVAYRGVKVSSPIHDKVAMAYYGSGSTNGFGSGSTTLATARQVNLISTATTTHGTYTVVLASPSIEERFNSGEQPTGLNLIVHDREISSGFYSGPSIANKQSPSGNSDGFLFTFATLVLTPR